uniref:Uncharacterized protein n=1 Tax=Oncorhynchus kisutch TaxID=8019 RepID=A0A8C7KCW1_ONCKI
MALATAGYWVRFPGPPVRKMYARITIKHLLNGIFLYCNPYVLSWKAILLCICRVCRHFSVMTDNGRWFICFLGEDEDIEEEDFDEEDDDYEEERVVVVGEDDEISGDKEEEDLGIDDEVDEDEIKAVQGEKRKQEPDKDDYEQKTTAYQVTNPFPLHPDTHPTYATTLSQL